MKILWIKDDKTGHLHKAKGLLRAIADLAETERVEYDVAWRWPGARALLAALGPLGLRVPARWVLKGLPDLSGVSCILSAGGATQWANAALARQEGKFNVFLGSPRSFKTACFALIAYHDAPSRQAPVYRFEIMPSAVTPAAAREAARLARLTDARTWGLLIGGDGEGIVWTDADHQAITGSFITQAREHGAQIRIATSRRTPPHIEATLRRMCEASGMLAGACWYHQRDPGAPALLAMMGACENLCVTADSMSMTHEAVSSGRPVIVLLPAAGGGDRLRKNLDHLAAARRLVLQTVAAMDIAGAVPPGGWHLIGHDPSRELAQAALDAYARHVGAGGG